MYVIGIGLRENGCGAGILVRVHTIIVIICITILSRWRKECKKCMGILFREIGLGVLV
jgi:hypothetical protein